MTDGNTGTNNKIISQIHIYGEPIRVRIKLNLNIPYIFEKFTDEILDLKYYNENIFRFIHGKFYLRSSTNITKMSI